MERVRASPTGRDLVFLALCARSPLSLGVASGCAIGSSTAGDGVTRLTLEPEFLSQCFREAGRGLFQFGLRTPF